MDTPSPDSRPVGESSTDQQAQRNVDSVVLGETIIQTWFPSFYPQDLVKAKVDRLYVCEWCFGYTEELLQHATHIKLCQLYANANGPPGGIVYDDGTIRIHEVDGEDHKLYTQNLSLFAKLFLDTKSVFYDVTTFRYYIMTIRDSSTDYDRVVGFFSKEKMSWDNNNLACILVFPPWQRKGLGQMLMAVSYELSRREGRLGGPEKPLSALGQKSYLAFWAGTIAQCVRSHKGKRLSVNDIVQKTWVAPEDVLSTLKAMDVIEPGPRAPAEAFIVKDRINAWLKMNRVSLERVLNAKHFVWDARSKAGNSRYKT